MKTEVFLSGGSVLPEDVRGRTVIVIDVLRASTTIVTALSHGARSVIPVGDMEEAGKMVANLDPSSYRLGGERDGVPIQGYHFGNSPREYTPQSIGDRTLILLTTNGSGAIVRCSEAAEVLVGGFVNATAVAGRALRAGRDVVIVCAGWRNRISLEDTLCAGLLLELIWQGNRSESMTDSAYIAWTLYQADRQDLLRPVSRCNHAKRLQKLGYADDIPICVVVDSIPLVPVYRDSQLVRLDEPDDETTVADAATGLA